MWSSGANDVYVGDLGGSIGHFDGVSWEPAQAGSGAVNILEGSGPDNVWAAFGANPADVEHFDGSAWSSVVSEGSGVLGIWTSGSDDTWIVTGGHTVVHDDGQALTTVTGAPATTTFVSGSSPSDVWFATTESDLSTIFVRWTGTAFETAGQVNRRVTSLAVVAPRNIFATTDDRHVVHYDGTSFTETPIDATHSLSLVGGTGPDDVFVGGTRELFHFDGTSWTPVRLTTDTTIGAQGAPQINALQVHPGFVDELYPSLFANTLSRLIRTEHW
jgi:hypothetical protein